MTGKFWGHDHAHHREHHADERTDGLEEPGEEALADETVMLESLREAVEGFEPVGPLPVEPVEGA